MASEKNDAPRVTVPICADLYEVVRQHAVRHGMNPTVAINSALRFMFVRSEALGTAALRDALKQGEEYKLPGEPEKQVAQASL